MLRPNPTDFFLKLSHFAPSQELNEILLLKKTKKVKIINLSTKKELKKMPERRWILFCLFGPSMTYVLVMLKKAGQKNPRAKGAKNKPTGFNIKDFKEKPEGDGSWINGGFFIVEPGALDYIADSSTSWESEPLQGLAADQQLVAHRHNGFWMPMDTLRDKNYLEELWKSGKAPWKVWV